jgi:trehalose/maltose hydrolase-like predicted phosphorylase
MSSLLSSHCQTKTIKAHLGNGHVGWQIGDCGLAASRSFLVGINDLTPNDQFRMALLPCWNSVGVRAGSDSLAQAFARGAQEYSQTLDMQSATLRTEYSLELNGIEVHVKTEAWLPLGELLAVRSLEIRAARDMDLEIEFGIAANPQPERHAFRSLQWPHRDYPAGYGQGFDEARMTYIWHPGHMEVLRAAHDERQAIWAVAAQAAGCGPWVGVGLAVAGLEDITSRDGENSFDAARAATVSLKSNQTRRIEFFAAFSRDEAPSRLASIAAQRARSTREAGYESLRASHDSQWRDLWRSDVIVEGDVTLAQQARADLFQLYQNAPRDRRFPFQIMGLASPGYFGSCFWDSDIYINGALLPFQNELGQNTARVRRRVLSKARQNAAAEGFRGARFSLICELVEGEENCLPHSPMARGEMHFSADAAIGAWNAFCASGDTTFLRLEAWPVLEAVAEYFASRVTWVGWENRYELLYVHSAEEALGQVNNCLYTNAAVRAALRHAARAAQLLGISPPPLWSDIAEKLYLPFNNETGLYQANSATEKPCDNRFLEVCAFYFAEMPATAAQLADAVSTAPIPWDMSLQAAVAAQAGDSARMAEHLNFQATNFAHSDDFLQRTEFRGNDAGPLLSGGGSLLQNLFYGASGLRWRETGLEPIHVPCLPEGVTRLTFPRVEWHDQTFAIEINGASRLSIGRTN